MRKTGADLCNTYNVIVRSDLQGDYIKENILLSEKLENINLEKKEFIRKINENLYRYNILKKRKLLNTRKLVTDYNLKLFFGEIDKIADLKNEYINQQNSNGFMDPQSIISIYEIIEERYYAAICLNAFTCDYVNSNYMNNKLINNSGKFNVESRAKRCLYLYPEDSTYLINNKEILKKCLLLIDNYFKTRDYCINLQIEIKKLEDNIKDSINNNSSHICSNIELLKQYKEMLLKVNEEIEKVKINKK